MLSSQSMHPVGWGALPSALLSFSRSAWSSAARALAANPFTRSLYPEGGIRKRQAPKSSVHFRPSRPAEGTNKEDSDAPRSQSRINYASRLKELKLKKLMLQINRHKADQALNECLVNSQLADAEKEKTDLTNKLNNLNRSNARLQEEKDHLQETFAQNQTAPDLQAHEHQFVNNLQRGLDDYWSAYKQPRPTKRR